MTDQVEAIVVAFIDAINRGDLDGLTALMTDDHVMCLLDEPPVSGKETLREAWRGYLAAFPEYTIYIERIAARGGHAGIVGNTTGSHLGLPDEEERRLPVIWTADVRGGLVASWNIVEDAPELSRELGLS